MLLLLFCQWGDGFPGQLFSKILPILQLNVYSFLLRLKEKYLWLSYYMTHD